MTCTTWVLLFLLAMLVNLNSRPRMLLIAATFVAVSGIVYFAFMAAWLTFFTALGVSQLVRVVLALIALGVGIINIKDFVALGHGPSLSIPERDHQLNCSSRSPLACGDLDEQVAMFVTVADP